MKLNLKSHKYDKITHNPAFYHVQSTQMVDSGRCLSAHRGTQEDHLAQFPLDWDYNQKKEQSLLRGNICPSWDGNQDNNAHPEKKNQ